MAKNKDTQEIFKRCHNSQEVPESMCVFCFHTFVAPTMELLEQLEQEHVCWEKPAPQTAGACPLTRCSQSRQIRFESPCIAAI